jgi:hypothetical protein
VVQTTIYELIPTCLKQAMTAGTEFLVWVLGMTERMTGQLPAPWLTKQMK